ncbi:paraquat-inducible protein B [Marinobacterium zhoushanense]|uniref:Paraquat-inducible protein B n=1 Tax=Marinobacterium zhoushanense TaxID=1679163 RepID=A0ABQ1KNY9_9GAMM|nr:MlaD family protein [Marinobacterium zhoushanense]GGC05468.1 paraquat-inducible protein B [Marinobacterium zhoushanense]
MDPKPEHTPTDQIRPLVRRHRGPSAVWILPLLAALIAGWLVYKSYSQAGVMIEVVFNSAEGLEVNKTRVIYRGLPSGTVRSLTLNEDLQTVTAEIEINANAQALLHEGTLFWLVKPQISLSGVRGLETLVSGHYIGVRPGEGEIAYRYTAAEEPPPATRDRDGLYLTLYADSVASIHRGSPVYYRDIDVGQVLDYRLSSGSDQILVDLFIEPIYAHLVRKHSRFWNANSLEIKGKLPDIDIRVGSLATIIAGGVHFYTPEPRDNPAAEDGDQFPLFADYEAAEDGVPVQLVFPGNTRLNVGTEVHSQGVRIGRVRDLSLTEDFSELHAELLIDPRARSMLRAGTRFWLAQPSLPASEFSLQDLLSGQHIELAPGQGAETFSFHALDEPPARPPVSDGLPIRLSADALGSISRGSPVLYRQLPIGTVIGYELSPSGDKVLIHAVIKERYRHLVGSRSRFWNSSGIEFKADIDEGISVHTGSVQTLLRGGISLFNPGGKQGSLQQAEPDFTLFADFDAATDEGRLLTDNGDELSVRLYAEERGAIAVGAPVLYRGVEVGEVRHYQLAKDGRAVEIRLSIPAPYRHLLSTASRFWIASGVTARANLREGVSVQSGSLTQMIKGGIAFETDTGGGKLSKNTRFQLYPSEQASREQVHNILIHFAPGADLAVGAPIRYRGAQVGRIDSITIADSTGGRIVRASLFREAEFLAREGARFWISEPTIRLSGIENPSNLLFGNHVEVLPGDGPPGDTFIALRRAPAYRPQPGLTVELHAKQLGSIAIGSPVLYREVPVGRVTGYEINLRGDGVLVYAHIQPSHATLVRSSSRFFNHSGIKARGGLFSGVDVNVASLETLVGGGVSFITDNLDAPGVDERAVFVLHDEPKAETPIIQAVHGEVTP